MFINSAPALSAHLDELDLLLFSIKKKSIQTEKKTKNCDNDFSAWAFIVMPLLCESPCGSLSSGNAVKAHQYETPICPRQHAGHNSISAFNEQQLLTWGNIWHISIVTDVGGSLDRSDYNATLSSTSAQSLLLECLTICWLFVWVIVLQHTNWVLPWWFGVLCRNMALESLVWIWG